jgi:cell wall-associated NlpC family hydrolase
MSTLRRFLRHAAVLSLLATASLTATAAPFDTNRDAARQDEAAPTSAPAGFFQRYSQNAQELIIKGLEFVGVRYRRGGTDPDTGLDCSGFVRTVFQESLGMMLPRSAAQMSEVGQKISANDLRPGDLVFFNTMKRAFSHVGIYVGNNQFVHSPRPGGEVRVEDLRQSYWIQRYNGARRVLE